MKLGRPKKNPLSRQEQGRRAQRAFRAALRASGQVVVRAIVAERVSQRLDHLISSKLPSKQAVTAAALEQGVAYLEANRGKAR